MKEMILWRNLTTQKGPHAVTRRSALTHCAPPCLSFSFHTLHVRARARTQASRVHVFVENKKIGRGAAAERRAFMQRGVDRERRPEEGAR